MNKRDITEAGIKLIAFFMLLRSVIVLLSMTLNSLLGGMQEIRQLVAALLVTLVPIIVSVVVIRKTDWILDRLYRAT